MQIQDSNKTNDYLNKGTLDKLVDKTVFHNEADNPTASVIIVTYKTDISLLERSIKALTDRAESTHEILLVENSDESRLQNFIQNYNVSYIKLKRNYGLNTGRNVGINYSKGHILIFLDDDAIPGENFIDEHVRAHRSNGILALRGKCLPRTKSIFNHFAFHYDLGNDIFPYMVNLEGNSSFKRETLIEVGGFNTALEGAGGHEGIEITKRIIERTNDRSSVIYWPGAVIYHDYSKSLLHYLKKQIRHQNHSKYVSTRHPDFINFLRSYKPISTKDERELDSITRIKLDIIRRINRHALKPNSIINRMVNYL